MKITVKYEREKQCVKQCVRPVKKYVKGDIIKGLVFKFCEKICKFDIEILEVREHGLMYVFSEYKYKVLKSDCDVMINDIIMCLYPLTVVKLRMLEDGTLTN